MASNLTPLDQLLQQTQQMEGEDLVTQYQDLVQSAPPEVIEQAHAEAFAQLSDEERQQIAAMLRSANDDPRQAFQHPGLSGGADDADPQRLAAMFGQAQRQQPGLVGNALGLSGGGGNPLMQMVISAVIQLVIGQLMGGRAGQGGIQSGGIDFGSILGQILSGGAGSAGGAGGVGAPSGQGRAQGGGMSSLDDLLQQAGGQVDTGDQRGPGDRAGGSAAPTGGTGGLEDILGQLGGSGGLGSILGQLATQMQSSGMDTSQQGGQQSRSGR